MSEWPFCSKDIPKSEIVFYSQIIAMYFVVEFSIYNITTSNQNINLWIVLLFNCLGQRGPITGPRAACGPRTEFLWPTIFLRIDLIGYVYVAVKQFFIKLPAIK